MLKWKGVYPAVVTFFDERGELALDSLEAHLENLALAGVHGFVPCGTTGESATLTATERAKVIAISVKVAKKHGLKVIAGCGSNNTAAVKPLLDEAAELGADAALVVTPYYNKPTQAGLIAHYRALADHSRIPIILYNVPGRTSVSIAPETVAQLFQHPNICGIKEASGQYGNWLALASQLNLKEKCLLAGDDDAFAPIQALGGVGIISASANVAPREFVKLYTLMESGKWPEAFQLQAKLLPLVKSLFQETSPAPAKEALSMMSAFPKSLRLPLVPVGSATAEAVRKALKELGLLS
jgi:4-hydroxy-tetrahydrodipicolinate synthase